jgi:threonine aldolase
VIPQDWREIMRGCERWLSASAPRTAAAILHDAADAVAADAWPDHYGEGALVEDFEAEMAQRLGHAAAMLIPSGTMAQQIALRLHCEARGVPTVAFHPTCHLALHEHAAYAHLHGLTAELIGDRDRLIGLDDITALRVPVGAVLLELPQREIGGRLPEWDDLVAQVDAVGQAGAAVHLDGARIWESAPYYDRPHAEIAGLFDTVYVSLYKGLGGFAGSVLAGPADLIAEARVWRRRHGGTLFGLFGFVAAARRGLDELAPRMGEFLAHAQAIAGALHDVAGVDVVPDPPQTPLFHLHLQGEPDALLERAVELARERGVWLFGPPAPSVVPGVSKVELNLGAPALQIAPAEAAELFAAVVGGGL